VESNIGYLEYEICKFLRITPKELGRKRIEDPAGVYFLELAMIDRWNKEAEHIKRQNAEIERKQHKSRR
jgi:hypothetical protein